MHSCLIERFIKSVIYSECGSFIIHLTISFNKSIVDGVKNLLTIKSKIILLTMITIILILESLFKAIIYGIAIESSDEWSEAIKDQKKSIK